MRAIIRDMISRYYKLGLFTLDQQTLKMGQTLITKQFLARSSKVWDTIDPSGKYDDALAKELIDEEKKRIADELAKITIDVLKALDKWDEAKELDDRRIETLDNPDEKMSWCIRQLTKIKVISPYDVIYLSEMESEEGVGLGYKRKPGEKKEDEVEQSTAAYDLG